MVFESIIAELLNKVIGEYIENLDYTQLKVSLWGGKNALSNPIAPRQLLSCLINHKFTFQKEITKRRQV